MKRPNHLVIVCGHGIWLGGPQKGWDEAEWLIESYKKGESTTYIDHIRAGLSILAQDHQAALAFSGGPTRAETKVSEARSYYNLALANSFFALLDERTQSQLATSRVILEERALDSYYNILLSMTEFWRCFSTWPERLTIVSHAFKRERLVNGHCKAIGFPLDRVVFIGIDPPGLDASASGQDDGARADAMTGVQLALGQWSEDPHGVGKDLARKRRRRNCWDVDQRLFFSKEEKERSGLVTSMLADGVEALAEDGTRPWAMP